MNATSTATAGSALDPAREEFLTRPLGILIGRHASPAVASMLFMACYQIVDGIMVGRALGPEAIASVNILYPIVAFFSGLAVMIGVGGNARIAVLLGAGKPREAGGILGLIICLGIGLGVTATLLGALFMPQILGFLGTSGRLGYFAGGYLRGILPFFVFMILVFILEQSTRNDGKPNLASAVMAGCAVLNIILDYLFLFVIGTGITGAAVASGLSQTLGALVFIGYFVRKTLAGRRSDIAAGAGGLRFGRPDWNLDIVRTIVVNGSSEFFNSLSMGITTFLFNRLILVYVGALGVAALTVVQYPMMLGIMVIMGIGAGTQPIFSYNHGAGLHHRVQGALRWSLGVSTAVGFLVFLAMGWPARFIAGLFLPGHAEALALTEEVSRIVRWSMLFLPLAMVASTYFTALEQAGKSLLVALSRGLVLPVAGLLLFPQLWGATGIWIVPIFAEGLTVLIAIGCYYLGETVAKRAFDSTAENSVFTQTISPVRATRTEVAL
ncbi:MAG: MATE family efflux transporter [Spirochaetaceae bacterium]|nr:MAG: MATE family efflux transporter [Spirochaetaceae bacterium]